MQSSDELRFEGFFTHTLMRNLCINEIKMTIQLHKWDGYQHHRTVETLAFFK